MVELCELQMLPEEDDWPADIDTRIANLDFGGDSALFASFDPSVSTDSLDSERLRERCRNRKDDFQLTFADSGHWQSGQLTTWGRIHSTEPLEEKTASAPDIARPKTTGTTNARPASLLANFVDRRDFEYSEHYMGAGRYVDVNDNEIGFSPADTSAVQTADRWRTARPAQRSPRTAVPSKPRRTFADLQKSFAPELEFLALPHQMPPLCDSASMSLSDVMLKVQREGMPPITSDLDLPLPALLQDDSPDSGLGCSGPIHIEDWASLSILLPKHVAEACSFFKSNAQLLGSSASNCIERSRRSEPCRTCFRVRRRIHPPNWAHSITSRHVLCDCTASEGDSGHELMPRPSRTNGRQSLRSRELSVVGLPIYSTKRSLVEAVVEGVAGFARGDGSQPLIAALCSLVEDGLKPGVSAWNMVKTVTAPGPATKDVYSIVKDLDSFEKSDNSRVEIFFEELLKENSLDCWLCYVVLKENVLRRLYTDGAFLLNSPSAYRSLLWRLVDSLALIPVLETRDYALQTRSMHWGGASRMAADSRVPKSSSVPARLSAQPTMKPSRIPLPLHRPSMYRTLSISRSPVRSLMASVLSDANEPGQLVVSRGERVRVLSRRGPLARCCRIRPRRSHVFTGIVPVANLLIQ